MEISKIERLILINQYTILEKLDSDESEMYALNKKVLENGYTRDYGEIVEHLSDELPEIVSEEVWDILQMYRSMNFSYKDLKDKGSLKEEDIKFKGFDGNNETSYMSYAKFVMHDLDRFDELRDNTGYPSYNSHWPKVDKYRRMLGAWKSVSERYNNKLSLEQINEILNA